MMNIHADWKAILAAIPGTSANVGKAKREMEKALRRAGYSRTEALEITVRYFRARNET